MNKPWTTCALGALLLVATAGAQTHTGSLEDGDQTLEGSGEYMDAYTFEAQEGQLITVTMTSDAFDTYLIVQSPGGERTMNDDAGGSDRSQVDMVASEGGTWTVVATSFSSGEVGPYEVVIETGKIADVEITEGRLDERDTVSPKGEYYDVHEITMAPGTEFYIELASLGFDGYLSVVTPSGMWHRNDDAGSTELSRVGPLTGEAGEFTVYATSAGSEAVGAYDLRVLTFPE